MELKDKLKDIRIVFIAESISSYGGLSINQTHFEQELKEDSDKIILILKEYFSEVFYYKNPIEFINNIDKHNSDVVFPNWFGENSRNRRGLLPAICEAYGIKFIGADTHSNILSSDKYLSKLYAKSFGLRTSEDVLIKSEKTGNLKKLKTLDLPIIVKPNFEGNSIGISNNSLFYSHEEALKRVQELLKVLNEHVLIEEYLEGKEVKVFIFGNENRIHFIHQLKLIVDGKDYFESEIFGFETKMESKEFRNQSVSIIDEVDIEIMKNIFNSLKKVEYIRIDGRVKNNRFYLLELSPDCGLTEHSSFSFAFDQEGLSYADAILSLITNSLFPEEFQIPNVLTSRDQTNMFSQ